MIKDKKFDINRDQKQAIKYNSGPLMIIAGAGTGKTLTLVEKIKHLIKTKLARPEEILALTFTDKAAQEMEERVDKALPFGYFQMWISTYHGFADRILRDEAIHIGLNPGYRILTHAETIIFFKKNLFLFDLNYYRPMGNPNRFIDGMLKHFSRLKDEDISPDEYLAWVKKKSADPEEKQKSLELAHAYKKYQSLKIKEDVADFSDLIFYLNQLLRKRKVILKKYQSIYKYVLIDEFQDTNICQYNLLKLLCPPKHKPNLTVVGDDSQAIYKFRGASVSNIMSFMKDYPDARQVTLVKNYRSNQTILDKAYRLIKNNDPDTLEAKLGISKKLISIHPDKKNAVHFYLAGNIEDEADYFAQEIIKLNKQYHYSDIALLVRANKHSEPFIRSLYRNGIPYQILGPGALFKQPEIKDLIAYLKFLTNLEDSASLFRIFAMDIFALDGKDIMLLSSAAKKTSLPLFQFIEIYLGFWNQDIYQKDFEIYRKYLPLIQEITRSKLLTIYKMIKRHISLLTKETAGQILYFFLQDSGYLNKIANIESENDEKKTLNITRFFDRLKTFENTHEDASVFALIEFIEMSLELGESPESEKITADLYDAVNILTVHSAKGMEFRVVFIVNLVSGRFPTTKKSDLIPIPEALIKETLPEGDYHLEEERRLFYVGLTRAKDKIIITSARFYGENKREKKLSPFINEILDKEIIAKCYQTVKEKNNQLSIFDFKKIEPKIIKNRHNVKNFSYSQLETYETCPLQYKYAYILNIPTIPNSAASFGSTIHKTLYKFYSMYVEKKSVNKDLLIKLYHQSWIPIGYGSTAHQEKVKKEGEKILQDYFDKFHQNNLKIISLEKLFKIKICSDISLTGKIDRVDLKNNDEINIIDYKTGKKPDKKILSKSLQLSLYALAATDRGTFNKPLNQIGLTFFYLKDNEGVPMQRTEEEIMQVKEKVVKIVSEIRNDNFIPRVGRWCDYCLYKIICDAWQ